jgi:quinohemoprotein amine dehydrogenase
VIYDRIDYIGVTPDSTLASYGDQQRARGYQQFVANGYQRGPDGRLHTDDDLEIGPVDVTWSLKVFYSQDGTDTAFVGSISPTGLFTPASKSANNNFDVWAIATAKVKKDLRGKTLVGKSYLVVTVPFYTFKGRRFVRDLDHWVDDGPVEQK